MLFRLLGGPLREPGKPLREARGAFDSIENMFLGRRLGSL
jgi:hypothetical protein